VEVRLFEQINRSVLVVVTQKANQNHPAELFNTAVSAILVLNLAFNPLDRTEGNDTKKAVAKSDILRQLGL
jgi:hypothetical protein